MSHVGALAAKNRKQFENDYKASVKAYKTAFEQKGSDQATLQKLRQEAINKGKAYFINSGMPKDLADMVSECDTSHKALAEFKDAIMKHVKSQRAKIQNLENELFAAEANRFKIQLDPQAMSANENRIKELQEQVSAEKAALKPLLDSATSMAGDTTKNKVLNGMMKLVSGFCGLIAAGIWLLFNIVFAAAKNVIGSKANFGDPVITTSVNGGIGGAYGFFTGLPSAHFARRFVTDFLDDKVDMHLTDQSLNKVLNEFTNLVDQKEPAKHKGKFFNYPPKKSTQVMPVVPEPSHKSSMLNNPLRTKPIPPTKA